MGWVRLHPYNIAQKVQVVVEHFRTFVAPLLLDGKSKAMVVVDTSIDDQLVYVNHALMGKLVESETLRQQATSNTKEQFGNSPDLNSELMNAVMDAQEAHSTMSTKVLNSAAVLAGIKDYPAQSFAPVGDPAWAAGRAFWATLGRVKTDYEEILLVLFSRADLS
jgi:hypothetical protein